MKALHLFKNNLKTAKKLLIFSKILTFGQNNIWSNEKKVVSLQKTCP